MQTQRHVLWRTGNYLIDHISIKLQQLPPVITAIRQALFDFRISELGNRRLIKLNISATGCVQRGNLLAPGFHDIRPKHIKIGINFLANLVAPCPVMNVTRARQGHLWNAAVRGDRLQKFKIRNIDRLGPFELSLDEHGVHISLLTTVIGITKILIRNRSAL